MADDLTVNVQAIAQAVAFYLEEWTFTPTPPIPVKGDRDFEDYQTGNEWTKKRVQEQRLSEARFVYGNGTLPPRPAQTPKGVSHTATPTIRLHLNYDKKLHIGGEFPQNYEPSRIYPRDAVPETSLNVNPKKDPKKIASDVTRIAKTYLECFKKANETRNEHEAKKVATRQNVTRLAKALGASDPTTNGRYHQNTYDTTERWVIHECGTFDLSSYSPDRVEIKQTTTDLETAIAIARLLRQSRRANKETAP